MKLLCGKCRTVLRRTENSRRKPQTLFRLPARILPRKLQLLPQPAPPLLRKLPPSRRNVLLRKPRRQEAVLRLRRQCRHSHPRPGRQLLPRQRRQPQGQPPHGRPRLLLRLPRRLFHVKQSPQQHSRLSLILLVRQSRICRRIRRRGGAGTIRLMTTRTTGKITLPGSRCSTPCRWQVWHSLCP